LKEKAGSILHDYGLDLDYLLVAKVAFKVGMPQDALLYIER